MFDYDQIQVEVGSPLTPPTATKRAIILGKQGEDGNQVVFHIEAFQKAYGDGDCRLIALRPTEDFIYPPNYVTEVTDSGDIDKVTGHRELTWNISAYDTALYGYGRVEIQYLPYKTHLDIDPTTGDQKIQYWDTVDKEWVDREDCFDEFGKVRDEYKGLLGTNKFKSVTYPTQIFESFVEGEPPEDAAAWIDEILKLKTEVEVLVEEVKDFSEILKGIDDSFHSEHPGEEATEEHIFNWLKDKWDTLDSKQDRLTDDAGVANIKGIRINKGTSFEKTFSLIHNIF